MWEYIPLLWRDVSDTRNYNGIYYLKSTSVIRKLGFWVNIFKEGLNNSFNPCWKIVGVLVLILYVWSQTTTVIWNLERAQRSLLFLTTMIFIQDSWTRYIEVEKRRDDLYTNQIIYCICSFLHKSASKYMHAQKKTTYTNRLNCSYF